jgi:hypothetical protein
MSNEVKIGEDISGLLTVKSPASLTNCDPVTNRALFDARYGTT